MIRPLRQRHRQVFVALGVLLPLAFAAGLAARKPPAIVKKLPAGLAPTPAPAAEFVWQRDGLFPNAPVSVSLFRAKTPDRFSFAVHLSAPADFVKPDLIVYWVPGSLNAHPDPNSNANPNPQPGGALPANAVLLGEFHSPWLPLPREAAAASGMLVLYSLADNEIVDVSKRLELKL